jgi:hypothetical protein
VATEFFGNYAPLLALLLGLLAGLAMRRSARWVLASAAVLALVQVVFWTVYLTFADARDADSDRNLGLALPFFLSLVAVIPYTAISAVVSASVIAVARHVGRRLAQKG